MALPILNKDSVKKEFEQLTLKLEEQLKTEELQEVDSKSLKEASEKVVQYDKAGKHERKAIAEKAKQSQKAFTLD